MIPGPCNFYLRPGQRCEVRDAHELSASQYLVVKVYGPVDKTAPYYDVTVRSAAITRATAEALDGRSAALPADTTKELVRGQLIVIRGIDTQFYIPPSGVDIEPDTSVDESGTTVNSTMAQRMVLQMQQQLQAAPAKPAPRVSGAPRAEPVEFEMAVLDEAPAEEGETGDGGRSKAKRAVAQYQSQAAQIIDQSARTRQRVPMPPPAPAAAARPQQGPPASAQGFGGVPIGGAPAPAAPAPATSPPTVTVEEILASDSFRKAIEREARQARLVRHAVVLGEKEYCVLIDPDGKREIKVGPARVFPGPYDKFMIQGSRNRVYDAYELLPQRALWLRVISQIAGAELAAKVPRGVQLDKEVYYPGDELLLSGVSGFFFPFNEIEILSPQTGEAVVGNDHSNVFIEAIGIDQKSGLRRPRGKSCVLSRTSKKAALPCQRLLPKLRRASSSKPRTPLGPRQEARLASGFPLG